MFTSIGISIDNSNYNKTYGQSVPYGTFEPDIQNGIPSPDTIIGGGGSNDIF
jgi:hypothetical protein